MNEQTAITTTNRAALLTVAPDHYQANPAAVYLARRTAESSRRTMRQALYTIANIYLARDPNPGEDQTALIDSITWSRLKAEDTAAIRAALAARVAPKTANKMLSALRGVLKVAITQTRAAARNAALADEHNADRITRWGRALQDDLQDALDALETIGGGSSELRGRALTAGEVAALLHACDDDPSPAGWRDGAIIALLSLTGIRRAELAALDLGDVSIEGGDSATLTVRHGKGNKARQIPVNDGALDALRDWLTVRGEDPGPLFVAINRGGRLALGESMTAQAIYNALAKRGRQAGLRTFSPHDFRRTFAGDLLDAGADISTVQRLMGHSNVTTTQKYDRRDERAKRKAVALLHLPYNRRRMV